MKFTPECEEQAFLLNSLCSFMTGTGTPEIHGDIDWLKVVELTSRGYLEPIMYHLYRRHSAVPKALIENWKKALHFTLLKNQQALEATVKVLDIMETHGVPAVILRGMALIYTTYPEPYLRPMYDVDLLVSSKAREEVRQIFSAKGLQPLKQLRSQLVYRLDHTTFEIHFFFLTPFRYQKAADFHSWICTRRRLSLPEGDIFVLEPEHGLLDLICHAFIHHELSNFHSLLDIGMFLNRHRLDWKQVAYWCRKAAIGRLVTFSLAYVEHLFDLDLEYGLKHLSAYYPKNANTVFSAYTAWLFGRANHIHYLRRKLYLLYVAERNNVKIRQIIRLMGASEWLPFIRLFLRF